MLLYCYHLLGTLQAAVRSTFSSWGNWGLEINLVTKALGLTANLLLFRNTTKLIQIYIQICTRTIYWKRQHQTVFAQIMLLRKTVVRAGEQCRCQAVDPDFVGPQVLPIFPGLHHAAVVRPTSEKASWRKGARLCLHRLDSAEGGTFHRQ